MAIRPRPGTPDFRRRVWHLLAGTGSSEGWFTPLSLFANAEDGAWVDASDLSTLYTDAAGTTPATSGDPMGRWTDRSGNDKHVTQSTATARPVITGSGPYYLQPDGVDDNFSFPLGANFIGDFALVLNTGIIFGSINTGIAPTWAYTKTPAYVPNGNVHAIIVLDRALTTNEKTEIAGYYADVVTATAVWEVNAFRNRTELTKIDLSYFEGAFITNAQGIFYGCTGLTVPPDVSGWTSVVNAREAFYGCTGLTVPPDVSGWTSVVNARGAFYGCTKLVAPLDVSRWNPLTITDGTDMMLNISTAGFDRAAYDAALISWDANYDLTLVNTAGINFGSAKYTTGGAAEAARNKLVANGWSIVDGGPA